MIESRARLLTELCAVIEATRPAHTLRIGIDGPDAAGKTTLADELAERLRAKRPVIRLSLDRFHRPAEARLRQGSLSPAGYYEDSFDNESLAEQVLRPLGPGGNGRYLEAVFDYRSETAAHPRTATAPPDAVLLLDGVFLLRPQLRGFWDLTVYLHVDPEVSLDRARHRDLGLFGSVAAIEQRYRQRYLPGQELYRAEAKPRTAANFVVEMNDPARPIIHKRPTPT